MAKKKRVSFAGRLGQAEMVNGASVAATGSEIGVLELAAEDELNERPAKRLWKVTAAPKRKTVPMKSGKRIKENIS